MRELPEKIRGFINDVDLVLLSLIGAVIIFDLPFFLGKTLPLHDTLGFLQMFFFFYNDFFHNGELAFWLPYSTYGIQSNFYLAAMTPAHFCAGAIGWLFGIKDVLFLFKFSTFLEHLIFLFGTYLLAKSLFKHRTTIAFVCVVAIGSMVFLSEVSWNFYVFYLLPLTIYLVRMFFVAFRPQYLILAMIVFIFSSLPGGAPYLALINVVALVIISAALLASNLKDIRKVLSLQRKDYILSAVSLSVLCLLAGAYWTFLKDASVSTELLVPARNPQTGQVDLNTFLIYGPYIDIWKFTELVNPLYRIDGFLKAGIHIFDLTLFIGLIPLVFVFYSVREARNAIWLAFAITIVVLALWSLGDKTFVAAALYKYFPPMRYFRHIGYVVSALKVLLPFLAGYGLDRYIGTLYRNETSENYKRTVFIAEIRVALLAVIGSTIIGSMAFGQRGAIFSELFQFDDVGAFQAVVVVYIALLIGVSIVLMSLLVRGRFHYVKHFCFFLIFCTVFELAAYQGAVNGIFHYLTRDLYGSYEDSFIVDKYDFQWKRTRSYPTSKGSITRFNLVKHINMYGQLFAGKQYVHSNNFISFDPCVPVGRIDFINNHVASLIRLKGGFVSSGILPQGRTSFAVADVGHGILPPEDDPFLAGLGCDSSKLKLMQDVVFSNNAGEIAQLLKVAKNIADVLVLSNVPDDIRSEWLSSPREVLLEDPEIRVVDFRANGLDLEVELPEGTGAWLYYADAWHPGWKALVNGAPVPVTQANLAFKAIRLEGGMNRIKLFFDAGIGGIGALVFSVLGIAFVALVCATVLFMVLKPHYRKDRPRL